MNDKFYDSFIGYLSTGQKKLLYEILQQSKISIPGFANLSKVPKPMLANLISKSESKFAKILLKKFTICKFNSFHDACSACTPENGLECMSYFLNHDLDELISSENILLTKFSDKSIPVSNEPVIEATPEKEARKESSFRTKYLSLKKKYTLLETDYNKSKTEIQKLNTLIFDHSKKQNESALACKQRETDMRKEIEALKFELSQIKKLNCELVSQKEMVEQQKKDEYTIIIVEKSTQSEKFGNTGDIAILVWDLHRNQLLTEDKFNSILYVESDLSFGTKCRMKSNKLLCPKLLAFDSTHSLLTYLEK